MKSSTNVFFKTPGEGGLENEKPDQTIYIGFDVRFLEHPGYYHSQFYNLSAVEGHIMTPQINNISFDVSM